MKATEPAVSVCMPVYNAARYLTECIDSILAQTFTDFELLIVDDGSTDNSRDIVRSYHDKRIRLIENRHDYIGSLNKLLDEAKGKYIARMDADDVMMPYRLAAQFGYMEKHIEVGVLGGGFQQIGQLHSKFKPLHKVSMQDMINTCCMAHPTVMIRTSVLKQYELHYEEDFKYAEDYRLWLQMMKHEIIFHNITTPVIKYRISNNQITSRHPKEQKERADIAKKDGAKWLLEKIKKVSYEEVNIPSSTNLLTVVIPFLNEKDEVGNTVRSIRNTAGNHVDIITINDHSDDNYDYQADLTKFKVTYICNSYRIGAAASKEKGTRLVRTPYFLLLDAHMRCFTLDWHNTIVEELQKNDRQILCCQAKALEKNCKNIVHERKVVTTYAAYLLFDYNYYIPDVHWIEDKKLWRLPDHKIACVLGACYAASKRYWKLLRGMEGLMHYGSEEPYISLKAWLEGGGCKMLPEVIFGHIYRETPPYRLVTAQMRYNLFVISSTLFPTSLQCWANTIAYKRNKSIYSDIQFWLSVNKENLTQLRQYYADTFHTNFEDVLKVNNAIDLKKYDMARHEKKRIPDLLEFLIESSRTSCVNLWEGCMGLLIVLCEYEEYLHSDDHTSLAGELLERITTQITPTAEFSLSFAHGLCGIGWGLIYMMRNGFADMDFSEELSVIDLKIMERDPKRITDYSFQSGIGGILCYVTNRLFLLQKNEKEFIFDTRYLDSLREAAKRALNEDTDFRTHSYALLLLKYNRDNWHVLQPKWKDVIDLPTFLPQNPKNWKNGMTGAVGYLCNLIQALQCTIE